MPAPGRFDLLNLPPSEWELDSWPTYRRDQLAGWIYRQRATDYGEMKNLPAELRNYLKDRYDLQVLKLREIQGSKDTTRKFLFGLPAGDAVECVLIPASPALYGERSDRHTLCISSQVGCAYGCKFCASGLEGWKRHLEPAEITAQIIETQRESGVPIHNLVFMGMGEPMANYENVRRAIEIINAPWGIGIGARKITISTSGLVPQIRQLADDPLQVRLAVSLHGATDEVRDRIMPINRKYPLLELMDACQYYSERKKQKLTFEYILISGVNDSREDARNLSRLAHTLRSKINLIPYNPVDGLEWERPSDARIREFVSELEARRCGSTVRLEKGRDIDAACGQLRLRHLKAN
jgi:23S rRNA (adenine2503-C2)-methyltransferase